MRLAIRGRFSILVILSLLVLLALGVSSALAQSPSGDPLEEGARLFAENCAVCHGENGRGRVGASLAKDWPSIRPDLRVRNTIANGVEGSVMPAWSQAAGGPFTDAQIDALTAFILSWQTGSPTTFLPVPTAEPRPVISAVPNVSGDPNRGAVIFDQNCAVCHGSNGEGRVGATLARSWSSFRSDLRIRNTIANGIEGSTMPAWSQLNGGPLSDEDVDDVVSFVLALSPIERVEPTAELPGAGPGSSLLRGWGGVVLTLGLFLLIVLAALLLQTRK